MVLSDLGNRLTSALQNVRKQMFISDDVIDQLVREVCAALMAADVNVHLVKKIQTNIKRKLADFVDKPHADKRREIQRVREYLLSARLMCVCVCDMIIFFPFMHTHI